MNDSRMCAVLVLLVLPFGCAGSDDPGGAESGSTSGSTSDGSTTTVTPTISGTTDASSSSSTTDAADSSSTSADCEGSSSTSGASSSSTGPGCEPGTEDCVCDEGACDEGLVCVKEDDADVCETPPNCPQERSEPNNDEANAEDLGEFDDFDPNFVVVDGRLPDESDEDWFTYHCDDFALGQVDMSYEMDTNIPVRVCQFIDCDVADNPTIVCPEGSEDATSPDGFPGCCSDLPMFDIQDIDCSPDDGDDSGQIYVRVDMPAQNMCVSYDLGVHC